MTTLLSGSPIIQNGKLIGAVTHVLVADPTEGYGIFIENMLSATENANNSLQKAAELNKTAPYGLWKELFLLFK